MISPTACGRGASIPATIPKPCADFSNWVKFRFMEEKQQQFREFVREHPGEFLRFTLDARSVLLDRTSPGRHRRRI